MVQIEDKPTTVEQDVAAPAAPAKRPSVSPSDIRQLIPALGLREYWYPALEDKKVKNKPVGVKICGEDLVFFRDTQGLVSALWNVCPHRGGSLMHGDCHYPGTVSCPYHGWTYDGDGNLLAVIPEGPDSKMPGKVRARKYPTQTHKGMVFVWMGNGEPAPIEEDVPPEFFDEVTLQLYNTEYWPVQWNLALENGGDAHVPYVHRNSVRQLMGPFMWSSPMGGQQKVVNGRAVVIERGEAGGLRIRTAMTKQAYQRYFPGLNAAWPKHKWRLLWTWIWAPGRKQVAKLPVWDCPEEWRGGHHLPSMYRGDHKTDFITRWCIPVTEKLSRNIEVKSVRPGNWLSSLWEKVSFKVYWRWAMWLNFSYQDFRAVNPQRYDTPEHLSPTDIHQVYWRRLVLQARGMMQAEDAESVPTTDAEKLSIELSRRDPEPK
ncbi:MAG TPA: Rieske 2Fe-2S domain-containing protein [Chloroflexota bacterium]|jgi:phenylpropionate dioxygenase-like ring-hydroxylating dioxygenase large terminal subunit